jgi:hypothetical protein
LHGTRKLRLIGQVIAGRALTDQETWWYEFANELREQCDDHVGKDWLPK